MTGQSRLKDGVLSHAYVPAIHALPNCSDIKTWMPGTRPGMTVYCLNDNHATRSIFVTPPI